MHQIVTPATLKETRKVCMASMMMPRPLQNKSYTGISQVKGECRRSLLERDDTVLF